MMEFDFDFRRLLLLALLLGGFAVFGGFQAPEVSKDGYHSAAQVRKAWSYCVVLFVAGAVSATLIDHTVGYMPPMSLRPGYILLGALLMFAGGFWLHTLKQSVGQSRGAQEVRTPLAFARKISSFSRIV